MLAYVHAWLCQVTCYAQVGRMYYISRLAKTSFSPSSAVCSWEIRAVMDGLAAPVALGRFQERGGSASVLCSMICTVTSAWSSFNLGTFTSCGLCSGPWIREY